MSDGETKPAAVKKSARKRKRVFVKKAAKRAKRTKPAVKAAGSKRAVKPAAILAAKSIPSSGEADITRTLEEIKKRFLEKCPRCASAMKNTFLNLGSNQRLLVNQCRVCKFYLPA